MSDSLTLSPASLSLLELIERQAALSLDVVHVWLDPVRRPASTAIRSLLHETEVAGEIPQSAPYRGSEGRDVSGRRDRAVPAAPWAGHRGLPDCLASGFGHAGRGDRPAGD